MNHREEKVLVYEHRAGDHGRESVFTMTRGELDHTLVRSMYSLVNRLAASLT